MAGSKGIPFVHNHGPDEGPGLACPESPLPDGRKQGECVRIARAVDAARVAGFGAEWRGGTSDRVHYGELARDTVSQPVHYTSHPSGVECIAITEHMSFCLGNAIKYVWRAGLKTDDPTRDLKKAAWYINRELTRLAALEKEA